jgi:potassium/hydrogen antiporter
VLLTVGVVEVWRADPDGWDWIGYLTAQLVVGVVVGLVVGRLGRWVVDHVRGAAAASLGVVTLAIAAISYGGAAVLGGSGLLAVYLTGVSLTGSERRSRSVLYFHEGWPRRRRACCSCSSAFSCSRANCSAISAPPW